MTVRYLFGERPNSEALIESGIALARLVLAGRQNLHDSHLREVLRIAVCKVTEARTHKHRTRYCSHKAYLHPELAVEHEHVHTVLSIRNRLLEAMPDDVERILREAEACTVTTDEHIALAAVDTSLCGWDRYVDAGIAVIDVKLTQERAGVPVFLDMNQAKKETHTFAAPLSSSLLQTKNG